MKFGGHRPANTIKTPMMTPVPPLHQPSGSATLPGESTAVNSKKQRQSESPVTHDTTGRKYPVVMLLEMLPVARFLLFTAIDSLGNVALPLV
jgi:hypothetical protein